MIEFSKAGLSLSLPVARALLEFAFKDDMCPTLGVGVDQGDVCATDGHTSLRFQRVTIKDGAAPTAYNGQVFRASYVEAQIKAAGRQGLVLLAWEGVSRAVFPALSQVEPRSGVEQTEPVSFNASYLARLELVTRACKRERVKGEKEAPATPGALLVSLGDERDPMRWEVGGSEWESECQHTAYVTIMPMGRGSAQSRRKGKAA